MFRAQSVRGHEHALRLAGTSAMPDGGRLAQGPVLPAIGRLAVGAGLPAKSRLVLHRAVCLLALCLALSSPAFAVVLPPAVAAQHPEFDRVGGGEMRWLGFKLYDAALWASARGEAAMGDAHVLSIRYARAISSERLVSVSLDEMRRLGVADEARLARWGEALAAALPSVQAGDTLAALHRPGEGARFWHQGQPSGEIRDAELARAFFAIWLDPRTREPELRAQLLGLADGGR